MIRIILSSEDKHMFFNLNNNKGKIDKSQKIGVIIESYDFQFIYIHRF